MDWIWTLVGFVFTLLIFSYLFGDNPLFRLTSYIFIGVTAGYVAVLVVYQVLLPRLVWPLWQGGWLIALVPLVLGIMLVTKLFPRLSVIGSIPMGYLVGVGAAVMIGGAIIGTLMGQVRAAIDIFPQQGPIAQVNPLVLLIEGVVFLIGTASTLAYFHFGVRNPDQAARRPRLVELGSNIGQVFLAITLGALFAGVYGAAITALIDRLTFLQDIITFFFT